MHRLVKQPPLWREGPACAAWIADGGSASAAQPSRAMALRLSPAARAARRAPSPAAARPAATQAASSCTAFARPSWIFTPEWPPFRPCACAAEGVQ